MWRRPVAIVRARVLTPEGETHAVRFADRVLSLGEPPQSGDVVHDARGAWVLPGLINAHDHLELNHYGAVKGQDRYTNVSQWVDDMRPRLRLDHRIQPGLLLPLPARGWIGGLKNLLAGVTLVAHHNPLYPSLRRLSPVRVLARFGWAHSFAMEQAPVGARGEPGGSVRDRYRATPRDAPFIVHLAEGTDADAGAELDRLEAVEGLQPNTVLVHGVAIDRDGWRRVGRAGASVVWCPASNQFLFGRTLDARHVIAEVGATRLALGTDARLTGSRDLLDELRLARHLSGLTPQALLTMVTTAPAAMLRCRSAGRLAVGAPADLVVLPPIEDAWLHVRRHDVCLVVINGRPRVGDTAMAPVFAARRVVTRPLVVDGVRKLADARMVRHLIWAGLAEPGVEVPE